MPDTLVELVTGRADLPCTVCGTTHTHDVELHYNDTTQELLIKRISKCFLGEDRYEERRTVKVETT